MAIYFILFLVPCLALEGDHLWNYDAQPVATALYEQNHVRMASDGGGGTIIVWADERNADSFEEWDVYAQRIHADGSPLWTTNGIGIALGAADQRDPEIAAVGSGKAIVVWESNSKVYAQLIGSNGSIQWDTNGVLICDYTTYKSAVAPDGSGGAFIACDTVQGVWCYHINNLGVLTPGNGIKLVNSILTGGGPEIVYAGSGQAIVVMGSGGCIKVQKIAADLSLPWGATPIDISCNVRREAYPAIDADGSGGAFIAWPRQRYSGNPPGNQVMVQHINTNGIAQWAVGGVILVDSAVVGGSDNAWSGNEIRPSVTADGTGGAVVAWNDWRNEPGSGGNDDIYAQRIDAAGTPVWTSGGISVWQYTGGSQRKPKIVGTGAGSSLVVFQDLGMGSWDIDAVKIEADGSKWPVSQSYVYYDGVPSTTDQTDPQVVFDGSGPAPTGAVIAWVDERVTQSDIYAQKLEIIVPRPDLVVEDIIFDPPNPGSYESFTVEIVARNQGDAGTGGGFSMGLDGLQSTIFMNSCYCPFNIEPGETGGCYINYPDGKPAGSYPVTACVDCSPMAQQNNVVDESDETNNSMDGTLYVSSPDSSPPQPDPMSWADPPHGISTTAISMTAVTAVDASPPVEYYFTCMTAGCNASGWQTDTSYTDSALAANTWYGWRVKARDSLNNETGWSITNYDYTDIETPTGVGFPSHGYGTTYINVSVNGSLSNLGEGQSGYIIYNVTQGTDSGWKQDRSSWLSDGLTPNTSYGFCARARNGYGRETPLSSTSYLLTSVAQPGAAAFSNITTSSIQANWTANGNPAGTEYFCENTVTGADSGWITSTFWNDTGLDCCTTYTYRVKARNAYGGEIGWTDLGSQKTIDCANACQADFDYDGDVDGKNLYTFLRNFGKPCIIKPCDGDFDGDGYVDDADLAKFFAKEFGRNDCPCVE